MAQFGFNPQEVQITNDFQPLPAGEYLVEVEKSEVKDTKNLDGKYLNFQFKVLDQRFNGRVLFDIAMIESDRSDENMMKALQGAREKITLMCQAAGKPQAQDSDELIGIPMIAKVKVKEGRDGLENSIVTYKSAGAVQPGAMQANQAPQAQYAPPAQPAQQYAQAPAQPAQPSWQRPA